ncbi:MAG TPA: hypothetical protein PK765_07745 [bacterium]|nr:hypothetical protein [bacterium]
MLKDPKVASAIAAYRAARSELAKTQQALTARREAMSQPEESIPLSDLIANYAQGIHELDSPFTRESRAEIVRNMPRFAHALKVRVDGRIVEYVDPSTGKLLDEDRMPRVTPSSRIEFFGPAVIDGIHFYQSPSPDLRDKMNPRSEPWAIQMMMGKFRPTSVRAPLPKSSFSPESQARIDATTPAGKLPIIGEWDTRPADVGNEKNPAKRSFGYFLRRKIEEHDRTLIDSMLAERRKARPDTSREDIVDELYELQTTALQLSGYINIFGDVNPGAGQWNQLTFYYDMRTPEARQAIRAANAGFIRSIRAERLERARELAADSDIVRMQVVPGDSPGTLFSRLQTFIALHENKRRFPHLALVHELPAPARTALLRSFLAEGTRLDENELRRLRTEDENRKRARKKQKPIPFTARGERDDSDLDAFFGFAPEGTAIDRPVTPGEWYAIGLDKLDRAIEHLSRDQSGTAMAELPPHQTYLIERMIRSPEAKRSMSVVASIESGSPKEGAPIRRTVKHGAESF